MNLECNLLPAAPGSQKCGRIHSDSVVGGEIGPPVSDSATAGSQNSGLPLWVAAQVLKV